jgi:hypothetical protein
MFFMIQQFGCSRVKHFTHDTRTAKKFAFLLLLIFSTQVMAVNHIYLGGSFGISDAKFSGNPLNISYLSGATITDAYPLNDRHDSAPVYSINGGYEFSNMTSLLSIALGLGLYNNVTNYHFQGLVIETAAGDPSNSLYNYAYNINNIRLMAEIQLTLMLSKLQPFLNFGFGPTWNKALQYHEFAVNNTGYPPLPGFQSNTSTHTAFQAGVGISTTLEQLLNIQSASQERIAIGYRYVDLGSVTFGTRGPSYPFALNLRNLQANEGYLSYIHIF